MRLVLAIDHGTTGSRAVLYDAEGNKVASAYQEFPQYFPQPGWMEHDPEEIWNSVSSSVDRVLQEVPGGSVAAIGISNQRETTVVWDAETGRPVCNAIVWQCRRTSGRCKQLKSEQDEVRFFRERTGLPIDAYFSATKIEWILKNVPAARIIAGKGRLRFGTTDAWILWKLTGGAVHATDYTNASRTMLFDIEKLRWDREILERFEIPGEMLPRVQQSSGLFGLTVARGALPAGIPITGIAGDQQAALFGQGCFEPGSVKNTYGTGAFVLLNVGRKRPVSEHGLITTLGCDASGEPVYVLEGAIFVAGSAVQWLRDGLKVLDSASLSEQMAESVPDTGGVYFVPALVGLGAPYWDQDARGCVVGITRGTNRNHLVRAALEAMCYQTRDVVEAMQKDSGLTTSELRVDGQATANSFLCQFQADILGVDVIRPADIETAARGAAYLAGLGAGLWESADQMKMSRKESKRFSPEMPRETSAVLYKGWLEAVKRTLSSYIS